MTVCKYTLKNKDESIRMNSAYRHGNKRGIQTLKEKDTIYSHNQEIAYVEGQLYLLYYIILCDRLVSADFGFMEAPGINPRDNKG